MNKPTLFLALSLLFFGFCKNENEATSPAILPKANQTSLPKAAQTSLPKATQTGLPTDDPAGATIAARFVPPPGFGRVLAPPNSFAHYLQNLPLKPEGAPVHLYDGSEKVRQDAHAAVLDLDTGVRDLQQCADAVMRLRAEHLFAQKKYADIHFNFVNGFRAEYAKWRAGHRISVQGNEAKWQSTSKESTSYESFRKYLDVVFSYAGTRSLAKEMKTTALADLQIGDVFIQGGSPGHAVIVVDLAVNPDTGEKRFLLAQSYMPAQEIHLLKNPVGGVWYGLDFGEELETPEWTFSKSDLRTW